MLHVITKPKLSHPRFLFSAILIGFLNIKGVSTTLTPSEIISVTNAARQTAGLSPVHPSDQLMAAADAKAKAMFASSTWDHNTPTQTPWQYITDTGYNYFFAGENLARNFDSAESVVKAWLDSPGHRDNLLNPHYLDIGVAVETGDFPDKPNSILIVQYFATDYDTINPPTENPNFSNPPILSAPTSFAIPRNTTILIVGSIIFTLITIYIVHQKHRHRLKRRPPPTTHWRK